MKRVVLAILLLTVLGCASRPRVVPTVERRKEDLLRGISRSSERLESLRGRGRIAVSTGQGIYSGSFSLLYKNPGKFRMDVNGPFGIQILAVTCVGDSVLAFLPLADMMLVSRASTPGVGGLGDVVTATDLVEFATASVSAARRLDPDEVALESDNGIDVLKYNDSGRTNRIEVNARSTTMVARSVFDSANTLLIRCDYSRFKLTKGVLRPHVVKMREKDPARSLELVYEYQSPNGIIDDREFHLKIPSGVEIIQNE